MEITPIGDSEAESESFLPLALNIPVEVFEHMIDMLYSAHARDTSSSIGTLHSCSLVCRAWRVRSQKRLFYKVELIDGTSLYKLATILDSRPHLRDYVHEVILNEPRLHGTTSIWAPFPALLSGKLPNLQQIDVLLRETDDTTYPKIPGRSKFKPLPYIPLHPRFPALLSSFNKVSTLLLDGTIFRSFTEFARMLHGLPKLEDLGCNSVSWTTPGGSHPSADFTEQPSWTTRNCVLPPFAPNLRMMQLLDMAKHGSERLIRTRGLYLTKLELSIPLSRRVEDPENGHGIDLSSCTQLQTLILSMTPWFSLDKHAMSVTELLTSWKPQHSEPVLHLKPYYPFFFTRQRFADALSQLKTIMEASLALDKVGEPAPPEAQESHTTPPYALYVTIYDWEAKRKWWGDFLLTCFEPWVGRQSAQYPVPGYFYTPPNSSYEWAKEEVNVVSEPKDIESSYPSVPKYAASEPESHPE